LRPVKGALSGSTRDFRGAPGHEQNVQVNATLAGRVVSMRGADEAALRFESVYRDYYGSIHAYARRRLPERADDVVAETFLVAWRRLEHLPKEPLPWLYGIARRVLADLRRGARRQRALAERIASEPADELSELPDRELADALAALSERERELLLLVYWEDLAPAQAARVVGCSRAAAVTRLWRARARLRERLER
jgi:RNA polymerase sigma-70 factor, ECF subfamily